MTSPTPNEAWRKRGFRLRETMPGMRQPNGATPPAVNPKILLAVGCALLFCFASLLFADAGSSNEIRRKLPGLRARYESYRQTSMAQPAASTWHEIERRLQEIAHFRQLEDWPQMRQHLAALLAQENDRQSPVYQFCLELQAQLPAQ